ncbi:MAG: exopolysaccharide biosynthesis polyprenyl glycosylphosphotransferase [Acidimicrobiia bacterium]|nr:exopolysaccharide biosynthesis polyprenyl glycosylphosphotransferase [Acidimicrobiia bacterium]
MRSKFLISVALADLVALALAVMVGSMIVFDSLLPWNGSPGTRVVPLLLMLAGAMIFASVVTESMSGPGVPRPSYGRMLSILLLTMATSAIGLVLFRDLYFSRRLFIVAPLAWLVFATAHRILRRRRPWQERLGIISAEKALISHLERADHADVVWVLDPRTEGDIELPEPDVTVTVDLRAVLSERVAQFVSSCDIAGYRIRPFTSVYEEHVGRVPLVHLAEGWEISAPLLQVAHWLPGKRLFDVILTAATAPIWLVVGVVAAIYVKIASPGPAVFKQRRIGLNGQPFTMLKFRTMVPDADAGGPRFAEENDSRLFRGGGFLRKSRLDEIPQLINVLIGDMSLVGPRAEQVPFVRAFRKQIPFYEHRHLVRPGITGWAQVSYGYADDHADTIEKLTYDLYYIKHMSPVFDLRVLVKSFLTVVTGSGAR